MSTKEVARLLGVTSARVVALIHAGRIEATMVDGRWVIGAAAMRKFKPRGPGRPHPK